MVVYHTLESIDTERADEQEEREHGFHELSQQPLLYGTVQSVFERLAMSFVALFLVTFTVLAAIVMIAFIGDEKYPPMRVFWAFVWLGLSKCIYLLATAAAAFLCSESFENWSTFRFIVPPLLGVLISAVLYSSSLSDDDYNSDTFFITGISIVKFFLIPVFLYTVYFAVAMFKTWQICNESKKPTPVKPQSKGRSCRM